MNKLMPVLLMLALIVSPVPRAALAQQQLTDQKIKTDIAKRQFYCCEMSLIVTTMRSR